MSLLGVQDGSETGPSSCFIAHDGQKAPGCKPRVKGRRSIIHVQY